MMMMTRTTAAIQIHLTPQALTMQMTGAPWAKETCPTVTRGPAVEGEGEEDANQVDSPNLQPRGEVTASLESFPLSF